MSASAAQGGHKYKESKCISEGLMHVAAWYCGIPGSKFTEFGE